MLVINRMLNSLHQTYKRASKSYLKTLKILLRYSIVDIPTETYDKSKI